MPYDSDPNGNYPVPMGHGSAGQRFDEERQRVLDRTKPVKPVVPPEREGKSTKLADLPHGQPSYGYVPTEQRYHDELIGVLDDIASHLNWIVDYLASDKLDKMRAEEKK